MAISVLAKPLERVPCSAKVCGHNTKRRTVNQNGVTKVLLTSCAQKKHHTVDNLFFRGRRKTQTRRYAGFFEAAMFKYSSLGVTILNFLSGSQKRPWRRDFGKSNEILHEKNIIFFVCFWSESRLVYGFWKRPKVTPELFVLTSFFDSHRRYTAMR